jgi:hypothetical protein
MLKRTIGAVALILAGAMHGWADPAKISVLSSTASSNGNRQQPILIDFEVQNTGGELSSPSMLEVDLTLVSSEMSSPTGEPGGYEPHKLEGNVPVLAPTEKAHVKVNTWLFSDRKFSTKEHTFHALNPNIGTLHLEVRYEPRPGAAQPSQPTTPALPALPNLPASPGQAAP